jgi:hypothetical protein
LSGEEIHGIDTLDFYSCEQLLTDEERGLVHAVR